MALFSDSTMATAFGREEENRGDFLDEPSGRAERSTTLGMTSVGDLSTLVEMTKGTWGVIGEEVEAEEAVRVIGVLGENTGLFEFGCYPCGGVGFVAVAVGLVEHNLAVVYNVVVIDFPEDYATVLGDAKVIAVGGLKHLRLRQ